MDTIGSFKEALMRSFLSGQTQDTSFYSPIKTGEYEFAEKPNYVNPYLTQPSHKKSNSSDFSYGNESCTSPFKKESIIRRHTENYGTESVVPDNFKTNLTPCRWNQTGWKYAHQKSDYFEHENKIRNTLGLSQHKLQQNRSHITDYKTQYKRAFKGKTFRDQDKVEKGVLNQANYLSECYPAIPMGENSVAKFQRQMHQVVNRRKNSENILDPSINSPSNKDEIKINDKYNKRRSRPHGQKHQKTEKYQQKEQKIHIKEVSKQKLKGGQVEENGRNHFYHHHRRHHSDYYAPKENADMSNGYINKTHNEFLRKIGPEMDEIESPLKFNELLKLNEEQLQKSLREIKRNKIDKISTEKKQTSSILNKLRSSRGFNGNKTFLSDPEVVNNKNKDGQIRVTKNNDKVDICNLTLGGIFMSPEQKSRYSDAVTWGGNIFVAQRSNGFHKKRTFITEWQSASNNKGVFVNK